MKIGVVIPLYRSAATVILSIQSLIESIDLITEIVLVDDNCPEQSGALAHNFLCNHEKIRMSGIDVRLINHVHNSGLSAAYNSGINALSTEIVLLLHPDIVVGGRLQIIELVAPLIDDHVTMTTHINGPVDKEYWMTLNVWQQMLLVPAQVKGAQGFNGQFDAIRRSSCLKVNGFDAVNFLNAGEDGDMIRKLRKIGRIVHTNAKVEHRHNFSKEFSLLNYLDKATQYGNAQGALLRRSDNLRETLESCTSLHREIILLGLIASIMSSNRLFTAASLLLLVVSASINPIKLFKLNQQISQLPKTIIAECLKHFAHSYGSIVGFLRGKQEISKIFSWRQIFSAQEKM